MMAMGQGELTGRNIYIVGTFNLGHPDGDRLTIAGPGMNFTPSPSNFALTGRSDAQIIADANSNVTMLTERQLGDAIGRSRQAIWFYEHGIVGAWFLVSKSSRPAATGGAMAAIIACRCRCRTHRNACEETAGHRRRKIDAAGIIGLAASFLWQIPS
jgi:hypothetical protein